MAVIAWPMRPYAKAVGAGGLVLKQISKRGIHEWFCHDKLSLARNVRW